MRTLYCLAVLCLPLGVAAASHDAQQNPAKRKTEVRTGEQIFSQNCARCHQPPTTLAPRITGTVVMHMRTRARLSANDEKLLLKYLAP